MTIMAWWDPPSVTVHITQAGIITSLTMPPRAQLTMCTPFLHWASDSALIRFLVSGVSGVCSVMKSACVGVCGRVRVSVKPRSGACQQCLDDKQSKSNRRDETESPPPQKTLTHVRPDLVQVGLLDAELLEGGGGEDGVEAQHLHVECLAPLGHLPDAG
jgi:hypothetical protein